MQTANKKVLRAGEVNITGAVRIATDTPKSNSSQAAVLNSTKQPKTEPKAIIAERKDSYAVIEVTCSCGEKLYIKCEYQAQKADPAGLDSQA